jgi:hypothetical protein
LLLLLLLLRLLEGCRSGQQQLQQLTQKHAVSCCMHRVNMLLQDGL